MTVDQTINSLVAPIADWLGAVVFYAVPVGEARLPLILVWLITLPFVLPLIKSWGFDPVWWGVINVVIVELGMILPPIGMNVFVIHCSIMRACRPDSQCR